MIDVEPLIPADAFEVFATGVDHPECVAFDSAGVLWAGGEAGQVYRIDGGGKVEQVATLGTFNAGLAFSPEDELFVCNPAQGVMRVRRDGTFECFGDQKLTCANFSVFDARGNLYVSDSGIFRKGGGGVFRFSADGRGERIIADMGYANGLSLSADERFLFIVESDTERIHRLELRTGQRDAFAENVSRFPDGIAIDATGNVYIACYASDDIHRISPDGRQRTLFAHDRWAIKLSRPTNLAFHGGYVYVANLGRQTITRAKTDVVGQPLANQRGRAR